MDKNGRQLLAWIEEGRGQGHGVDYLAWLPISRRGQPSHGNLIKLIIPILGRQANFLSSNEATLAIWLLWLGASDLREQFPLWPHRHVHPIYGHPLADNKCLPWSRGLLAIARDLGIKHGTFIGTTIPYIATSDFMVTVLLRRLPKLIAVAAKPASAVSGEIKLPRRAIERLALESGYAQELEIPWRIMSDALVGLALRENLLLALGSSRLPPSVPLNLIDDFCASVGDLLRLGEAVHAATDKVRDHLKLSVDVASGLFHHGLWRRKIPIDLREPLVLSRPAKLTDFSWATSEAVAIFGEYDHE